MSIKSPLFHSLLERFKAGILSPENLCFAPEDVAAPGEDDILSFPEGEAYAHFHEVGLEALEKKSVGALVLAGGMATRFAYDQPKALFPIWQDKTFLELKIRSLCGQGIPLFIMTSFHTHTTISAFLETHDYFGYRSEVTLFQQSHLPRIYRDGSMRYQQGEVDCATSGHGDFLDALHKEGLLKAFLEQGGEYLLFSNIDNLGATFEPALLGMHIEKQPGMTIEVAAKAPGDKGGAPALIQGRCQLVEGFLFPPDFDQDLIKVFNTASYIFSAQALDRPFELPWYVVEKEVKDQKVLQFERLAGDLSRELDALCVQVPRESRFLPVKKQEDVSLVHACIEEKYSHL